MAMLRLTQGKNSTQGDTLIVDLTTGISRVESSNGSVAESKVFLRPARAAKIKLQPPSANQSDEHPRNLIGLAVSDRVRELRTGRV